MIFHPPIEEMLASRGLSELDVVAKFLETKEKTTTAKHFGLCRSTVAKIIAKNGVKSRFTDEEKKRMIELNALGWSFVRIGKELGFSNKTVQRFLNKEIGEKNVKINYSQFLAKHNLTEERVIEIYYEAGESTTKTASFLGTANTTPIKDILIKNNIKTPRERAIQLIEDKKEEIIQRYISLESAQSIAKSFGVANGVIFKRLKKWGVKTRGNNPKTENISGILEANKKFIISEYISNGLIGKIATSVGLKHGPIYDFLRKNGIKIENKRNLRIKNIMDKHKDAMYDYYYVKMLSLHEVGEIYGLYAAVVGDIFKRFGWKTREKPNKRINGLERKFALILDEIGVKYEQQFQINKWSYDFYLPVYNLLIEISGDYWHGLPIKYPTPNELQLKSQKRDVFKKKMAEKNGFKTLFIWEWEINNRLDLVKSLLKNFSSDIPKQSSLLNFITDEHKEVLLN